MARRPSAKGSRTLATNPAEIVEPDASESVSRIRAVGSDGQTVSVLVGQKSVAKIHSADAVALGLTIGTPWTPELAERLFDAAQRHAATRHALRLVGARPRAKADLVRRLRLGGHADSHARHAADRLEEAGIIDDTAYAEAAASSLATRRGTTQRAIETKLRQRGVTRDHATHAAREATEHLDEAQSAVDLATRRVERMRSLDDIPAIKRRLYAFLIRRGFDSDHARSAVETALRHAEQAGDLD